MIFYHPRGVFLVISDLNNVLQLFQAALTPAFFLTGTGAILSVTSSRLATTIERARLVYQNLKQDQNVSMHKEELTILDKCCSWIYRAFVFCSLSALFTCTVITLIFVGHFFLKPDEIGSIISWLFAASTTSLTIAIFILVYETILSKKLLHFMTKV